MVLMELQYTPYPHFLKELVRVVLKHLGHREVGCSQSPPIREDWFWCSTVPQRPTKKTILRGPLCPKKAEFLNHPIPLQISLTTFKTPLLHWAKNLGEGMPALFTIMAVAEAIQCRKTKLERL